MTIIVTSPHSPRSTAIGDLNKIYDPARFANAADAAEAVEEIKRHITNTPAHYGAVGDGVTDDSAAFLLADASGHDYIDMEGLTYSTTLSAGDLTKKYYNGTLYIVNVAGNREVWRNRAPMERTEAYRLGTKSRFFDWEGSNLLWVGTSIPHQGAGLNGYPEQFGGMVGAASVVNNAWSGSHATFNDLLDIDETDIGEIKALSMTDADVAAGLGYYGSGTIFDDSYDGITKASQMTLEHRVTEPFQTTDFDVVFLDHNHNDRRDAWGTLSPESLSVTAVSVGTTTALTVSDVGTVVEGDFLGLRVEGIDGLDYAFGRVQSVAGSVVTIAYDSDGMAGTMTSATAYKLERSTLFGAFEAVIYGTKNASLRYGSGNVQIVLSSAPSEYTNGAFDNSIHSVAVALRQLADKWGLAYFDVTAAMDIGEDDHVYYLPDEVHPTTPETRKILASHWANWAQGGVDRVVGPDGFVDAGADLKVHASRYVYDRFSGGAKSGGSIADDPVALNEDDFTGDLSAYTTGGNAPTIVAAPWDAGAFAIETTTDVAESDSYITDAIAIGDNVRLAFDFQFTAPVDDGDLPRLIGLAQVRNASAGVNHEVQMIITSAEAVVLRHVYFDAEGAVVGSETTAALSPDTKYSVVFEAIRETATESGFALLYVNGALVMRSRMYNSHATDSTAYRFGQIGSSYGADMTVYMGNIYVGEIPVSGSFADPSIQYQTGAGTLQIADAATGGNVSSSAMNMNYTKIGRLVFVNCSFNGISTAGLTAASHLHFIGLPFNPSAANTSVNSDVRLTKSVPPPRLGIQTATPSRFRISTVSDAGVIDYVRAQSIVSGTTQIVLSFSYVTDE